MLAAAIVAGCSPGPSSAVPQKPGLDVVTGLFPLAEVARQVGGSRITLNDLTPAGMLPERLAIGPSQLAQIRAANVVIEIGLGFQPELERAAELAGNALDILPAIGGSDPHVWLDPVLMQQVVALVAQAFERADPAGRAGYERGARDFTAALGALDISYRSSLADCARHDLVTSSDAFGRLSARYGLTEHAISPVSSGADSRIGPDPAHLAALADLVRAKHLTTVFTEPMWSQDATQTLARMTHTRTEVLDPIEGLGAADSPLRKTYISLMTDNLATLLTALGCSNSEA
jgi:zinc transport system substrate-binding protein